MLSRQARPASPPSARASPPKGPPEIRKDADGPDARSGSDEESKRRASRTDSRTASCDLRAHVRLNSLRARSLSHQFLTTPDLWAPSARIPSNVGLLHPSTTARFAFRVLQASLSAYCECPKRTLARPGSYNRTSRRSGSNGLIKCFARGPAPAVNSAARRKRSPRPPRCPPGPKMALMRSGTLNRHTSAPLLKGSTSAVPPQCPPQSALPPSFRKAGSDFFKTLHKK